MSGEITNCIYIPRSVTDETLANPATIGKRLLEPLKSLSGNVINILEDVAVDNECEVHRHEADLWICLEGEVKFEVGGELIEPRAKELKTGGIDTRELKSRPRNIRGATMYTLRQGDILYIPAGVPHAHRAAGTARLFIVKVPQREIPLDEIPGWNSATLS